jgi:V8-like Glu-specific endopeptidase
MRAVVAVVVLAGTGCWHAHESTVRPAAKLDEGVLNPRFFAPPIALAVAEDAIVRIVGPVTTCSGTLVDEDLVLTAHHCVVSLGKRGEFLSTTLQPADIHIELGGDYLPWGTVTVKDIVNPPCGEKGGRGDVAILVLSHKLIGITPYTARLDSGPRLGETLDPAGFGRCSLSPDGIHRTIRLGGDVSGVGNGTIMMTASICPGDSGGPVFARGSHEIVGVVSLSAMDGDEHTRNASIMARVDSFRPLFGLARQIADGADRSELPPLSCE